MNHPLLSNRPGSDFNVRPRPALSLLLLVLAGATAPAGAAVTHYVNLGSATPASPFLSWATAATTIQEAVDAAAAGDEVVVTNGVYQTGSRAVYGSVLNRVAVSKPLSIRSVNGPTVTAIRGYQMPGTTNGDTAIRCVYLTNGALLAGFTLSNGAVRRVGDAAKERSGGGAWCESKSVVLSNCVFTANAANNGGGGVYQGTLKQCLLSGNWAGNGGGACLSTLLASALRGNRADTGGGASSGALTNCTVVGNGATLGGGVYGATLCNSIVRSNSASSAANYSTDSQLSYCCTTPLPSGGTSNLDVEPKLVDGVHLAVNSPCLGRGSSPLADSLDLDGQAWVNPPALGCDEPFIPPSGPITLSLEVSATNTAVGNLVSCQATLVGQVSAWRWEFGDGAVLSNLAQVTHAWTAVGDYPLVLRAYNATYPTGVSTTVTVHVFLDVHYVVWNSPTPSSPYTSWATAATNLQDAVDATWGPGALVLVSNGVYQTGGRVIHGSLTNRVAVTKPVTVRSLNGPAVTTIRGCQVPATTNGDEAVRCVYLTNGAVLAGFTLSQGAVRMTGDVLREQSGGGGWCESTTAVISNCVLTANTARFYGGAAYQGTLQRCVLSSNSASGGGGAHLCALNSCALYGNRADDGGGAASCALTNCTLLGNSANNGGGVQVCRLLNSIIRSNSAVTAINYTGDSQLDYSCTAPLPAGGTGNLDADPQLADAWHLNVFSPCLGQGSSAGVSGLDLDGQAWFNPPAIGCAERSVAAGGPISLSIGASATNTALGIAVSFQASGVGQVSAWRWEFDDGTLASNVVSVFHAWATEGAYPVVLRAYNQTYPTGVTATVTIRVFGLTVYVALDSPNPQPPYGSWSTAAQSIQDAVDAASPGGLVLVSNGAYQTGGRAIYGAMTNRVAVTKPITVQSVNGPRVTVIQGYQVPETTNGDAAVRCAYLTNGAVLSGFTLTHGATRATGGTSTSQEIHGGGVMCRTTNEVVTNCVITGNWAAGVGGGAYSGTLRNCVVSSNGCRFDGGGADKGNLYNCFLTGNTAADEGGAAYSATLYNCTLTGNSARYTGGAYGSTLNNCIVCFNQASYEANYSRSTLNYCCTTPAPTNGSGNITAEPCLTDFHLYPHSPCRRAGSAAYASGADLDGETWLSPPSIGCDEYHAGAVIGPLAVDSQASASNASVGWPVEFVGQISGPTVASVWEFGDGTTLSNRLTASHAWTSPGDYTVVLRAYNDDHPAGVTASTRVHVAWFVYYVSAASSNPVPPYDSWESAARNIQDAVDVAIPGGVVWVNDGVYQTGGRVANGATTNRLAVTKPLTVQSINGPAATIIRGYQVPGLTNGETAVRCVYLTNGAVLAGFTLSHGAVRAAGNDLTERSGGGLWCESTSAVASNCVLWANAAAYHGGGAFQGTLQRCLLKGNSASYGGAASSATLNNCAVTANSASLGGGAYAGALTNCTLVGNTAVQSGGVYAASVVNSIVRSNLASSAANYDSGSQLSYSCTSPLPGAGVGNLDLDPGLADGVHLNLASPCLRQGSPAAVTGLDLDGQAWATPPAIGCDEYRRENMTGPLAVAIRPAHGIVAVGFPLTTGASITGLWNADSWDFGDGTISSNQVSVRHAWAVPGDYSVTLQAYNQTHPEGVSAALTIRVVSVVHYVSLASLNPVPPYSSWQTAAQNIQDAVDAAVTPGALVLVSNGLYQSGGVGLAGAITNRVSITKPVVVRSLNGPAVTILQGAPAPGTTNGPGAVRCAFLAGGAVLSGFTLTNGATCGGGDTTWAQSGGGLWCASTNECASNCVIRGNCAAAYGGGTCGGTLLNCVVTDNASRLGGGGSCNSVADNCFYTRNAVAAGSGGGSYNGTLRQCTLTGNSATAAGGAYLGALNNCIVYDNQAPTNANSSGALLNYCCTTPAPGSGTGNITNAPQIASGSHLALASPCRGAGGMGYARGVDLDGEPWLSPPSIGCDEYRMGSMTGPLTVTVQASLAYVAVGSAVDLAGQVEGRTVASVWDFGDGIVVSNRPSTQHSWSTPGEYTVALRVYNETYPAGVSDTVRITVAAPPTHYVAADSLTPVAPYRSWATAAATLQDALDVASSNALVLVTNGLYAAGGRALQGLLTNRVAVTRPVTVRSVNGPTVTVIQGSPTPDTNGGIGAVRCAYLTDGAVLSGFTLTGGATLSSGDDYVERAGGGLWCSSSQATVSNCTVVDNSAAGYGGGVWRGTLYNCLVTGNKSLRAGGVGGGSGTVMYNCAIISNSAKCSGGVEGGTLRNCTIAWNEAWDPTGGCSTSGGVYGANLRSCVIFYNRSAPNSNHQSCTLDYCCTTPAPASGTGNITQEPQLVSSWHLSGGSPCRGAGYRWSVVGLDLDGEAWLNPPSMGCDEYRIGSSTGPLAVTAQAAWAYVAVGFTVDLTGTMEGRTVATSWDFGDGTIVSNQVFARHAWTVPGEYPVVFTAYNETYPTGVSARLLMRVAPRPIHYVAADASQPLPPYASWDTAARTIQDAVDVACPGSVVLVSNGLYTVGGRAVSGTLTNRVAVTKPLTVLSVNGPTHTLIQGARVPGTTNGEGAIRCVYLTNGAVLSGFTLTNGATRVTGDPLQEQSGGGVLGVSAGSLVTNCIVTGNAAVNGGGACGGTLNNCQFLGNWAWNGGATYQSLLNNCAVLGNSAFTAGGGSCYGTLHNCTVTGNAAASGGGAYSTTNHNCILYYNQAASGSNYSGGTFDYCCTTPAPAAGQGNLTTDPQLTDAFHLEMASPCHGAGSADYVSGMDLDGQRWEVPPCIGCDEFAAAWVTDSLTLTVRSSAAQVAPGTAVNLTGTIGGHATANVWAFGDGATASNQLYVSHAWSAVGDYTVLFTAYNQEYGRGVSTSAVIRVAPQPEIPPQPVQYVAAGSTHPVPPYISWDTAAATIQDAVDIALPGALVLVSNGVYQTGGRAIHGAMTNRVAITRPVTVRSVNGPAVTCIEGHQLPGLTNGDGALRCAYLTNGAALSGFTLRAGATRTTGTYETERSGGGIWCESTNVLITNCVLSGNAANYYAGGAYAGTLERCLLTGNSASGGGGTYLSTLYSSALSGNRADNGGAAYTSRLVHCTLTDNSAINAGGVYACTLFNSIVRHNAATTATNYSADSQLNSCCTWPVPITGAENWDFDPQLYDGVHLASSSPCVGLGRNPVASPLDLDGEPWANPPAIGCDQPSALATGPISVAILAPTNTGLGVPVSCQAALAGTVQTWRWELEDGTLLSNVLFVSQGWATPGDHPVTLRAYNQTYPEGVAATLTVRAWDTDVHYVVSNNPAASPPYTSWATAATNIQDAVDAAWGAGALVLVSNGVFQAGGRAVRGATLNRVAVTKPMTVCSANGPALTIIRGYQLPGTVNGEGAVRGVYLTNGAVLAGFTVCNGATRVSDSGGGIWCESANALVTNCVLSANAASAYAGGAYAGTLDRCLLTGNQASGGGGAYGSALRNCGLTRNHADNGGAAYSSSLVNCTLTDNSALSAGGAYACTLLNCVAHRNVAATAPNYSTDSQLNHCCTTPLPAAGLGNLEADPELQADGIHLCAYSPCLGQGGYLTTIGLDIDGQPWASPPAIGCDEGALPASGPISLRIVASQTNAALGAPIVFEAVVVGQVSGLRWNFGDGSAPSDLLALSHAWTVAGDYPVVLWAGNQTYPDGVSTALTIRVTNTVHYVVGDSPSPTFPYASWATAASSLQDALDAAGTGDEVVVSNGVYAVGGRAVRDFMTNRVAITRPVRVRSLNGPAVTVIRGYQVPGATNGDGAIRCAYLANGALLAGFTLSNGAVRAPLWWSDEAQDRSGGGVWCESPRAVVSNCVIAFNAAASYGGGAYQGTLKNCLLTGNVASVGGGAGAAGVNTCVLNNCLLTGNRGTTGGGAYACNLTNCTVAGNSATSGGGVGTSVLVNSIVMGNTASSNANYTPDCQLNYCCVTPWPTGGQGNFTNDPLFINLAGGDLRLQPLSPCVNAGANANVSGDKDFDGFPRVVGGTADVGAYELQTPLSRLSSTWLRQFGLPNDGSADDADPDGDGLNTFQEWVAGTAPTDAASTLRLLAPSEGLLGVLLRWTGVSNRAYVVERSTNLNGHPPFQVLATGLPGRAGTTTFLDTNAPASSSVFYRVGVVPGR